MTADSSPRRSGGAADFLRQNARASFGLGLLLLFGTVALVGPFFVPAPDALLGLPHQAPSWAHWLGTTGQGQDVLAQTVVGTRLSLLIGLGVGLSTVVWGALVGMTAGYFGDRTDAVLSLITNVFLVIPGLPLAIVLAAYLPAGPLSVALVLVITGWAWNARVLRAQTLALRQRDFVSAAVVSGESSGWIIVREILPNMLTILVAQLIGSTIYAIGAEVPHEFLGLGDLSTVTWGTNLYWASNDSALLTGAWWTYLPSGLCVALVGFALVMLNSGFDQVTNPRLRSEGRWRSALLGRGVFLGQSTPVVSP